MKTEIINNLLGGMSPGHFISAMLFVLLGALINIGYDVYNRDKSSKNTPEPFKFSFFLKDNWFRILLNLIVAFSVVRFANDMFPGVGESMFFSFCLGLVFDWMIVLLRNVQHEIRKRLGTTHVEAIE